MNTRIIFYIIFGLIGTIVIPIILQSGYIFAIDQAVSINGGIPKIGSNNYWIGWISQLFIYMSIPIWVLEKLLILMTFTLPVLGVYLYIKKIIKTPSCGALFFALSFSVFNPMLYSRFLDGQINIYVFYALFPLFLYFVKQFFHERTLKSTLIVGLWSILLVLTTLHSVYFIFFVFIVFTLGNLREIYREKQITSISIGFIAILCIQLLWLIPLFTTTESKVFSTISQIQSFDSMQQSAFANIPDNKNPYREILSMRGYWGDYENRFVESHDIFNDNSKNDWIYFIWAIIVAGIVYTYKNKSSDRNLFLSLGILGFILSLGVTNGTIFTPINAVLYEHLPYYTGFREPQKFVLLLIMAYIYFGYFGIIAIGKLLQKLKIHRTVVYIVLIICIISPVMYNFNILFGFRGQVSVQQYPQDWQDTKDHLAINACNDCIYNTLVFPWHGYISISWTGKIVGAWITQYFGENMLYSDTLEIGNVYTSSTRPESKIIEKYVAPNGLFREQKNISEKTFKYFLNDLEKLGIKNIILLKEADYSWYENILKEMTELNLIEIKLENSMLYVYEIMYKFNKR